MRRGLVSPPMQGGPETGIVPGRCRADRERAAGGSNSANWQSDSSGNRIVRYGRTASRNHEAPPV